MPSSSSISTTSTIAVTQREENPSSTTAWASVGNSAQTSLVSYATGGKAFQPVFNPATSSFSTDPILDNRRDAFTFWRTDYMDRSWKNSALGTSPASFGPINWEGTLGGPIDATGATGVVEMGIANAFPLGYYSSYETANIMFLPGNNTLSADTQQVQLSGGFNVACTVVNFDNDSPASPLYTGPLNNWNGYSAPLANLQNIAPGNRGGN